jgi:hypothetical protein
MAYADCPEADVAGWAFAAAATFECSLIVRAARIG